jgi:hypothetical protein
VFPIKRLVRSLLLILPTLALIFLLLQPAAIHAATTTITDMNKWQHPTKTVLSAYKLVLLKVELIDKKYPIFYVRFPSSSSLQNSVEFDKFLHVLAKANAYWPYKLTDGTRSVKVETSLSAKKITNVIYSGMDTYLKSRSPIPITIQQAGLHPLPVLSFTGKLNERIAQILAKPSSYTNKDFKNGLIQDFSNSIDSTYILVSEYYKEAMFDNIHIGDTLDSLKKTLGVPAFTENNVLFYKTSKFYMCFNGKNRIEQAIFAPITAPRTADMLKKMIETLQQDKGLNEILNDTPSTFRQLFEENGHIHGGGWYATSAAGIKIEEFEANTISVYNNFTGKLYKTDGQSRYTVEFVDKDSTVERMEWQLLAHLDNNERFVKEGKISPGKIYNIIYDWITSDSQYFTIRTMDRSQPDRYVHAMVVGDFYWITDKYLLYLDFINNLPYLLPTESPNPDKIDILQKVGLTHDENSIDTALIVSVDSNSFTLEINGKKIKIQYSLDAAGKIKLQLKN